MKTGPRIKIELTRTDKILEVLSWLLLALLWIIPILSYSGLPDSLPVHYSVSGEVNEWGHKMSIFVLPIVGALLVVLMTIINRYPHIFSFPLKLTHENAHRQYKIATELVRGLKLAVLIILILVVVFTIRTARGESAGLGFWFIPIAITIVTVLILIHIVRMHKGR
jgi:uncharacterized membrane protein